MKMVHVNDDEANEMKHALLVIKSNLMRALSVPEMFKLDDRKQMARRIAVINGMLSKLDKA